MKLAFIDLHWPLLIVGWRPSLLGWRPSLLGRCQPSPCLPFLPSFLPPSLPSFLPSFLFSMDCLIVWLVRAVRVAVLNWWKHSFAMNPAIHFRVTQHDLFVPTIASFSCAGHWPYIIVHHSLSFINYRCIHNYTVLQHKFIEVLIQYIHSRKLPTSSLAESLTDLNGCWAKVAPFLTLTPHGSFGSSLVLDLAARSK